MEKYLEVQERKMYQAPNLEQHSRWQLVTGESTGFNNSILPDFLEQTTDFMDGDTK